MASKRGSIFQQGQSENPYNEADEVADVPRQATAAQLAKRKIKSAKIRRPAGATSGLTPTPSFAPPSSTFNFGGSAAQENSSASGTNPFSFLPQAQQQNTTNGGAFGSGASQSFPPAQPSTQGNAFGTSSFSFGGTTGTTTAMPSSTPAFTFGSGSTNAFSAPAPAPNSNGPTSSGFSIFGTQSSQPQSNMFGASNAVSSGGSAAPASGGLFSATAAPSANTFGSFRSGTPDNSASAAAPASNSFGSLAPTTTAAPTNSLFAKQDTATVNAPTSNLFASEAPATTAAPASSLFSNPTPKMTSASTSTTFASPAPAPIAPTNSIFGTPTPAAPSTSSLFAKSTPAAPPSGSLFTKSTPAATTAPSSSLFANTQPTTSPFTGSLFSKAPSTPQPSSSGSIFSGGATATSSTPATNLFASTTPAITSTSTAATPGTNFGANFGSTSASAAPATSFKFGSTNATTALQDSPATPKPFSFGAQASAAPSAPSSDLPAKTPSTSAGSISKTSSSAMTPSKPFSFFGSINQPATSQPSTLGNSSSAATATPASSSKLNNTTRTAEEKEPRATTTTPAPKFGPFGSASAATRETKPASSPSLFTPSMSQRTEPAPASSMPTLTGSVTSEESANVEMPKLPKLTPPPSWNVPRAVSEEANKIKQQIAHINEAYREKMVNSPVAADWTSMSQWHYRQTVTLVKKYVELRKQAAAAKGITGNESVLSTKRKANEEVTRQVSEESPIKKARGGDMPGTASLNAPAKVNASTSSTSAIFGNALRKDANFTSDEPSPSNAPEKQVREPVAKDSSSTVSKPTGFQPAGFQPVGFKPVGFKPTGFQPTGFKSSFSGSASQGTSGGLLGQFAGKAKTAEELRAERKKKAKDEDYDSDEETEEQWSARWDKEEADRQAKVDETKKATPTFKFSAASSDVSSTSNPFGGLSKPTSGASTPGLLSSRVGSPAPSNGGGRSVFDTPEAAHTPSSNIFGHLSSGPSSNNHDSDEDEDEDEDEEEAAGSHSQPEPSNAHAPKKRSLGEDDSDSSETLEETMRRKKGTTSGPSLLDRMTRNNSEVESDGPGKESGKSGPAPSVLGQTSGNQTPKAPFQFFDFTKAAAQSAPPKQDTFAGDQTFKVGSPIRFGTTMKTTTTFGKSLGEPGGSTETPSKPAPTSTFSFLNPNAGQSGPGSLSAFSSRAATPFSEAETSGKDSAAENDEEDHDTQERLDLSGLTPEEEAENDVLFHSEQALAKRQVEKQWENFARGRLWIMKNKESGKAFLRMRLSSGNTPVNYSLLPKFKTTVVGKNQVMVRATMVKKDGSVGTVFFALKTSDLAQEFSRVYNENLPA